MPAVSSSFHTAPGTIHRDRLQDPADSNEDPEFVSSSLSRRFDWGHSLSNMRKSNGNLSKRAKFHRCLAMLVRCEK